MLTNKSTVAGFYLTYSVGLLSVSSLNSIRKDVITKQSVHSTVFVSNKSNSTNHVRTE